jgi:hypothetical protein
MNEEQFRKVYELCKQYPNLPMTPAYLASVFSTPQGMTAPLMLDEDGAMVYGVYVTVVDAEGVAREEYVGPVRIEEGEL